MAKKMPAFLTKAEDAKSDAKMGMKGKMPDKMKGKMPEKMKGKKGAKK